MFNIGIYIKFSQLLNFLFKMRKDTINREGIDNY